MQPCVVVAHTTAEAVKAEKVSAQDIKCQPGALIDDVVAVRRFGVLLGAIPGCFEAQRPGNFRTRFSPIVVVRSAVGVSTGTSAAPNKRISNSHDHLARS